MTFLEAVAAAKRGEFVFWNGWNHGECWTRFNPGPGSPTEGYSLDDVIALVSATFRPSSEHWRHHS